MDVLRRTHIRELLIYRNTFLRREKNFEVLLGILQYIASAVIIVVSTTIKSFL